MQRKQNFSNRSSCRETFHALLPARRRRGNPGDQTKNVWMDPQTIAKKPNSVLDSLFIFGAIHAGSPINYMDRLGWFGYTVLFNMLGGLLLVSTLRLVRNKDLIVERRNNSADDADSS